MRALDRAKRLQAALSRLAERRDRVVEKAHAEFRLDLVAALDLVDDETVALVLRGLELDRAQESLQLALTMALDERNHRRGQPISTRRSGAVPSLQDDPHEAETEVPPPMPSLAELEGDEDDLTELDAPDTPLPPPPPVPRLISTPGEARALYGSGTDAGEAAAAVLSDDGYRYPEPGEAAVELPDGTIVAAPP